MPPTVRTSGAPYRAFDSKAGLFKAVIEATVAGGSIRADVPVEERPAILAVIEERDPRRQVELYAATQPGIHRRSGPLLRALQAAAGADDELRALWNAIEARRLAGQGQFAGMLAEREVMRSGVSVEHARDVVWTLCSLAVHDLLVISRGWTAEQYQDWLARALAVELLAEAEHPVSQDGE